MNNLVDENKQNKESQVSNELLEKGAPESEELKKTDKLTVKLLLRAEDVQFRSTRPDLKKNGTVLGDAGVLKFFDDGSLVFTAKDSSEILLNVKLDDVTSIRNDGTALILYYKGANAITTMVSGGIYDMFSFAGLLGAVGPAVVSQASPGLGWGLEAGYSNKFDLRRWTDAIQSHYPNIKVTHLDNKGTNKIALWFLVIFFGALTFIWLILFVGRSI